jgi:deazaflavin-dependent oxidoreductase (nitroreductase family)
VEGIAKVPHVRRDGSVARLVRWMARQAWFRRFVGPRVVPRLDRVLHRVSGGRFLLASFYLDAIMLTTIGRRSGQERHAPIASFEVDGALIVVGSNFGRTSHPAWTHNLLADPRAWVEQHGHRVPVRGRLLEGDERERAWRGVLAEWPPFETYAAAAGGARQIRLFALEPIATDEAATA